MFNRNNYADYNDLSRAFKRIYELENKINLLERFLKVQKVTREQSDSFFAEVVTSYEKITETKSKKNK